MGQATGGIRAAPPKQVQRRVGRVIPPRRNADFGLAVHHGRRMVKLERPTCDV